MSYKRLTETKKINEYCSTVECAEYCEDCYVGNLYERLAELEDKIENGTLIDITEKFITEEEIKNKTRYLICEHYLTKMIVDFADNKAEAEKKLEELSKNPWQARLLGV